MKILTQLLGFSYFFFRITPDLQRIMLDLILGSATMIFFVIALQFAKENDIYRKKLGKE